MKIQSDKQSLIPDAFMLDWDNLSETELKRLVVQLEKTRGDVMLDLRDAQVSITLSNPQDKQNVICVELGGESKYIFISGTASCCSLRMAHPYLHHLPSPEG